MTSTKKTDADTLKALAEKVKSGHDKVIATYRKSLEHARDVGEILEQAETLCKRSRTSWQTWVRDQAGLSVPTANGYVTIFKEWAKLEAADGINTIKGALDFLRPKKPRTTTTTTTRKKPIIPRSKLQEVATTRNVTPGLIEAILTDLGLKVEFTDDAPAAA